MLHYMTNEKTPARFWFDPLCPWAWMTSRWMLEVEKIRDVEVTWHIMSLQVLNQDKLDDLPEFYRERVATGQWWRPVRVVAAAKAKYGDEVVGKLYTALGTRLHNQGQELSRELFESALTEIGLPADLADAADTDEYDAAITASHEEGISLVGQEVGTPVIAVPGADGEPIAFFGPVVTPAPKGEAAGRLWDGTLLVAGTPGFFEIKRTRTRGPLFE